MCPLPWTTRRPCEITAESLATGAKHRSRYDLIYSCVFNRADVAKLSKNTSSHNILETILKIAQEKPPPENVPPDIVGRFFSILEKHQFRVDRSRPREQIYRLLEELFRGNWNSAKICWIVQLDVILEFCSRRREPSSYFRFRFGFWKEWVCNIWWELKGEVIIYRCDTMVTVW